MARRVDGVLDAVEQPRPGAADGEHATTPPTSRPRACAVFTNS
jgi:hypothetical protein